MIELKHNSHAGRLIVFEGTDGAGKTTMIQMTRAYLANRLGPDRVLVEKQPTDLSRKTRLFQKMMYCSKHDDINYRAVQLLTLSDRVQHNYEVIEPALASGKVVVCDRYLYTSIANMFARGYRNEEWFFDAASEIVRPDLAFLAYVRPEVAVRRIKSRPEECDRHLNEDFLAKVCNEFLKLRSAADFKVIETERPAEVAFAAVRGELDKLLEAVR